MEDEQSEAGTSSTGGANVSRMRRAVSAIPSESTLGRDVQAKIGQHLRAMYDDVVRQGVPDRFVELLAQLDQRDEAKDDVATRDEGIER